MRPEAVHTVSCNTSSRYWLPNGFSFQRFAGERTIQGATNMQMGMIGLGRMGANMVRRLLRGGHECVVFDVSADAVKGLVKEGAIGASSLDDFRAKLKKPRVAWMMVPAAVVEKTLADLSSRFQRDDIIVDGGNSY